MTQKKTKLGVLALMLEDYRRCFLASTGADGVCKRGSGRPVGRGGVRFPARSHEPGARSSRSWRNIIMRSWMEF